MWMIALALFMAPDPPSQPDTPVVIVVSSDHLQERRGSDMYVRDRWMVDEIRSSVNRDFSDRRDSPDVQIIVMTPNEFDLSNFVGFFYYVHVDDIGIVIMQSGNEICPTTWVLSRARIHDDTEPNWYGSRLGNADFGMPLTTVGAQPCDASYIADAIADQISLWQIGDWPPEPETGP